MNTNIRKSRVTNREGCRYRVPCQWNLDLLEELLCDYDNKEIVEYLKYGWPIETENVQVNNSVPTNQKGAREHPEELKQYVNSELKQKSIIGPFMDNPWDNKTRISPIDTRPKRDSPELRVILNLSHPFEQGSVNEAINKDYYLGKDTNLRFPSIDNLVDLIMKKGVGCAIFKRDMRKCYRQIYFDPGSVHLVGFSVEGEIYFDITLSMGLKILTYICQKITDALIFIYQKNGFSGINYLDDLAGAEKWSQAYAVYQALGDLFRNLGIWESANKACPPDVVMVFLGILADTVKLILQITPD